MSDVDDSSLTELRSSLQSVRQLRSSTVGSIILMAIGLAVVAGSFVYGISRLRPLQREISQKEI